MMVRTSWKWIIPVSLFKTFPCVSTYAIKVMIFKCNRESESP